MAETFHIECNAFTGSTKTGVYFPERDNDDLTRAKTAEDIRSGQVENVNRVIAIDIAAGTARDATREIAQDILNAVDELPLAPHVRDILEDVFGCGTVAQVIRDMEAA